MYRGNCSRADTIHIGIEPTGLPWVWGFPWVWVWGLKFNPHGSPENRSNAAGVIQQAYNKTMYTKLCRIVTSMHALVGRSVYSAR